MKEVSNNFSSSIEMVALMALEIDLISEILHLFDSA
jgi:hypothetical protein